MFISIQNIQHIHVSSNKINIVYKPVDSISLEACLESSMLNDLTVLTIF